MSYYESADELCQDLEVELLIRQEATLNALTRRDRLSEYAADPIASGQLYHRVREVLSELRGNAQFRKSVLWLAGPAGTAEQLPWGVGLAEQVSRQGLRVYLVGRELGSVSVASVRCEELSDKLRKRLGDAIPEDAVAVGTDVEGVRWIVSRTADMKAPVEAARDDDWAVLFIDSTPEYGESIPEHPADAVFLVASFRDHSQAELREICTRLSSHPLLGVLPLGPMLAEGVATDSAFGSTRTDSISGSTRTGSLWDDSRPQSGGEKGREQTVSHSRAANEARERPHSEPSLAREDDGAVTQTSWADLADRTRKQMPQRSAPASTEKPPAVGVVPPQEPPLPSPEVGLSDEAPAVHETSWGDRIAAMREGAPSLAGEVVPSKRQRSRPNKKEREKKLQATNVQKKKIEFVPDGTGTIPGDSAEDSMPPVEPVVVIQPVAKKEEPRIQEVRMAPRIESVVEPEVAEPVAEPEAEPATEPEAESTVKPAAEPADSPASAKPQREAEPEEELPELDPFEEAAARRGLAGSSGVTVSDPVRGSGGVLEKVGRVSEPEPAAAPEERTVALLTMWEREANRRALPGKVFRRLIGTLAACGVLVLAGWFGYNYWLAHEATLGEDAGTTGTDSSLAAGSHDPDPRSGEADPDGAELPTPPKEAENSEPEAASETQEDGKKSEIGARLPADGDEDRQDTAPPIDSNVDVRASEFVRERLSPEQPSDGGFVVHLSSFREKAQAVHEIARLRQSGLDPEYVHTKVPRKGTWYRVFVGHFDTFDHARTAAVKMQTEMDLGRIHIVSRGGTGHPVPVVAPKKEPGRDAPGSGG